MEIGGNRGLFVGASGKKILKFIKFKKNFEKVVVNGKKLCYNKGTFAAER